MTADLIVYAIVAGVLVFWLKTILGTRHGDERERDNPFSPKSDSSAPAPGPRNDNIIDLPRPANATAPIRVTKTTLVSRVKIETPDAEHGLRAIAQHNQGFSLDKFMEGAESAFEMIVTAFAKGDRETLRALLTPGVYNDFDRVLNDRSLRGETVETKIEAVRGMDIVAASITGNTALISVRFTAQETCLIRNAAGSIIGGEPDKTTTMIDIWTFGHDVTSSNPVWYLHETRDEFAETHKTPVPETT